MLALFVVYAFFGFVFGSVTFLRGYKYRYVLRDALFWPAIMVRHLAEDW
jgi:hypothetical protein